MFSLFNPFKKTMHNGAMPPKTWIDEQTKRTAHTPDLWKIQKYTGQLLFACGEEMRGQPYSPLVERLASPLFLENAFTCKPMSLWKKQLGSENTIVVPLEEQMAEVPYAIIRGELYGITSPALVLLDNIRANGLSFIRKKVSVFFKSSRTDWLPSKAEYRETDTMTELHNVWMYQGRPEYWKDQIVGGITRKVDGPRTILISRHGSGHNPFMFTPVQTYKPKKPWIVDQYYWYSKEENDR